MSRILRSTLACVAGVVAAFLVVALSDLLVGRAFPLPSGAQLADRESARAAIAAVPLPALLLIMAGWVLAGGLGAFVAVRLEPHRRLICGGIVTGIFLLATIANLAMLPHPAWMWPASLVLIPLVGWAGARAAAATAEAVAHQPAPSV